MLARTTFVLVAAAVWAGCFDTNTVECANSTVVCPAGSVCTADGMGCTDNGCGDGNVDSAAGEECDDGNLTDTDDCRADCKLNVCGDDAIDMQGERTDTCDDGNNSNGDDCVMVTVDGVPGQCRPARCGDEHKRLEGPDAEECDDGNNISNDGCKDDCSSDETCGNGHTDVHLDKNVIDDPECRGPASEQHPGCVEACDDGNQAGGDGCEPDCTFTPSDCGNGEIEAGEACDDGNQIDGGLFDYCKNDCTKFHPAECGAPETYAVCDDAIDVADKSDPRDALRAIGVCDLGEDDSIVVTAFEFDPAAQPDTWQVARGFGNYVADLDGDPNTPPQRLYAPREGEAFLMLSTGRIAAPDAEGVVTEDTNSQVKHMGNGNSGDDALPPPFKAEDGSDGGMGGTPFVGCDNGEPGGDRDCSDTLQTQWQKTNGKVNDRIYFTFDTVVPAATHGFMFDFVFCSSEWPGSVGTVFNDMFFVYQVDPTPDDPNANPPVDAYSGNVAFIPDPNDPKKGLPVTITALDSYFDGPGYTKAEPQLWGTGFETHACSDWFTARGGVQPGAEITVGFFLADMSDANWATVALIDAFRWDCEGCVPSEADDCGIKPQ
jgi:cysteine-rich repeat protein